MKRIIYTCDRRGKEIPDDRYHITITRETADEPELIGESCYPDYCYDCMVSVSVYMSVMPKDSPQDKPEEIAPEETIDLLEKPDTFPDPEDMEDPEESVLCELKAMEEKPKGRLTPEQKNQIFDAYRHGKSYSMIAEIVGVDISKVKNALHYARVRGII